MTDLKVAAPSPRRRWRRLALPLLLGLVLPAGLIGLALEFWGAAPGRVAARLTAAGSWLALWRLGLVAALVLAWGPVVAALARAWGLEPAQARALQEWRWTLALVLLAAELVLVQNIFGLLERFGGG